MTDDERILKEEILDLTSKLDEKKKILFSRRLINMNLSKIIGCVKDISFTINRDTQEWSISYKHETQKYNPNNYVPDTDDGSDSDVKSSDDITSKITRIKFGKAEGNKYYIKGGIKLNVYRNSSGELRIMNPDYDFIIDMEDHKMLIHKYSENIDIPESCALAVFQYMIDNKWDDISIINYLSIV